MRNRLKSVKLREILGIALAAAAVLICLAALRDIPHGTKKTFAAGGRESGIIPPAPPDGTVRINEADAEELQQLPGIGETIAQAIIDEREAHGPFLYPEDLMAVRGIGESKYEQIRPWLDYSIPTTEGE